MFHMPHIDSVTVKGAVLMDRCTKRAGAHLEVIVLQRQRRHAHALAAGEAVRTLSLTLEDLKGDDKKHTIAASKHLQDPYEKVPPSAVAGEGVRTVTLTLDDLKSKFKKHTIAAALQCTGNRRHELKAVKEVQVRCGSTPSFFLTIHAVSFRRC